MKLINSPINNVKLICPQDMKIGDIGIMRNNPIDNHNGELIGRFCNTIVSFSNPKSTWIRFTEKVFMVELLKPGQQIVLEQE